MVDALFQLPERTVTLDDPVAGLSGIIVLHSTALGPAAGGCRLWRYPSQQACVRDAMRLAEGMSYKNAMADLPLGGGKAVLRLPDQPFDRNALFEAFGRAVEKLEGTYVTAEDVGTSVSDMAAVSTLTRHVAGLDARPGRPGGDPSPWTARGVFRGMEVAVARRLGRTLDGVTVAVQGLGNVGFALCGLLHEAGARLVVADTRSDVVDRAVEMFDAKAVPVDEILFADVEVLAPCALGAVLTGASIARLRAKVVCGAANNQLAHAADGRCLADRNILYAPDYVVNAGGIINVSAEYLGWALEEVAPRVDAIGARLGSLFDSADTLGVAPHEAANLAAQAIVAARRAPDRAAA